MDPSKENPKDNGIKLTPEEKKALENAGMLETFQTLSEDDLDEAMPKRRKCMPGHDQ